MSTTDFIPPLFLQNQSADEVHQKMLDFFPDTWDKSEGQFLWDVTRDTALVKAEQAEFVLSEVLKNMFPLWAENTMLDYLADCRGIERKPAVKATGKVTVTAISGTEIPQGFKFLTPATYDNAGVVFVTDYAVETTDKPVTISITAETGGSIGNVAAGTITLMDSPIDGILSIVNESATSGGIDEETDESLQERLVEYDRNQGVSYVGNLMDFERWAKEVEGVGTAKAYGAEDSDGVVTIIITDTTNNPASVELCTSVYNHIMRPDNPSQRLSNVNAVPLVKAPTVKNIVITAQVRLDDGFTLDVVKKNYLDRLKEYSETKDAETKILYNKITGILIETDGVLEYYNASVNGAASDIILNTGEMVVFDIEGVVLKA